MRWFWQRGKKKQDEQKAKDAAKAATLVAGEKPMAAPRSGGLGREPRDELLKFARDALIASGARVRVEDDDLLSATRADGSVVRYSTSPARVREAGGTELLVEGGDALVGMLAAAAEHGGVTALRLAPVAPEADVPRLALAALAGLPLKWAGGIPKAGQVESAQDEPAVELVYRVAARDRQGRLDEWLRLAFAVEPAKGALGEARVPVAAERLAAGAATTLPAGAAQLAASAFERGRAELAPRLDAAAAFLALRTAEDYARRMDDLTTTHDRWRRENPDAAREAEAALARERAALREVYQADVSAELEAICFVTSPIAQIRLEQPTSGDPTVVAFDAGRGVLGPLLCARCGERVASGGVCAHGHLLCDGCLQACATCQNWRCPLCEPATYATCATCGEAACPECARTCVRCGDVACADHVWTCVVGGEALCIACVAQCDRCERIMCREDTFHCLGCGRDMCSCAAPGECKSCGVLYCADCRGAEGTCPGCRDLRPATDDDLRELARAGERVPELAVSRRWLVGRNAESSVWATRGLGRQEFYVLGPDDALVASRRKGLLAR